MPSKHYIEQRDRFNQRLTLDLVTDMDRPVKLDAYLNALLKSQSLEAWNGKPEALREWAAKCVADYLLRAQFRIIGHSN